MQKNYVVSILSVWEEKISVLAESEDDAFDKVGRGERENTLSLTMIDDYDEE